MSFELMTPDKTKMIVSESIQDVNVRINQGITEIYGSGNQSLGVSYEHWPETGEDIYIFNLFVQDEYINIAGAYRQTPDSSFQDIHGSSKTELFSMLSDAWNLQMTRCFLHENAESIGFSKEDLSKIFTSDSCARFLYSVLSDVEGLSFDETPSLDHIDVHTASSCLKEAIAFYNEDPQLIDSYLAGNLFYCVADKGYSFLATGVDQKDAETAAMKWYSKTFWEPGHFHIGKPEWEDFKALDKQEPVFSKAYLKPTPMNTQEFWNLIAAVNSHTDCNDNESVLQATREQLSRLSASDIAEWYKIYQSFHKKADRDDLWRECARCGIHATDDGFHYFRAWLISRGKDVYSAVMANPNSLSKYVPDPRFARFEEYNYVSWDVYTEKACQEKYGKKGLAEHKSQWISENKEYIEEIAQVSQSTFDDACDRLFGRKIEKEFDIFKAISSDKKPSLDDQIQSASICSSEAHSASDVKSKATDLEH